MNMKPKQKQRCAKYSRESGPCNLQIIVTWSVSPGSKVPLAWTKVTLPSVVVRRTSKSPSWSMSYWKSKKNTGICNRTQFGSSWVSGPNGSRGGILKVYPPPNDHFRAHPIFMHKKRTQPNKVREQERIYRCEQWRKVKRLLGPVHTNPFSFENGVFIRKRIESFPSTLSFSNRFRCPH